MPRIAMHLWPALLSCLLLFALSGCAAQALRAAGRKKSHQNSVSTPSSPSTLMKA